MALLLLGQAIVMALGAALFWRRHNALRDEVALLTRTVAALEARAAASSTRRARRAESGVVTPMTEVATAPTLTAINTPIARAGRAWTPPKPVANDRLDEGLRNILLTVATMAPAFALFFGVDIGAVISFGVSIAAGMMLIALRPDWSRAAWAGVIGAMIWGGLGIQLGAAAASPIAFAVPIAATGLSALLYAHLRQLAPGALVTLISVVAALALASQTSVVGAGGVAYGIIVATAAIVGAMSLRLDALHIAAFIAALAGLLVLSGQDAAAIWFTPVATWAGALFLGVAIIRVPQLGARGAAIAATGVLAPLAMIGALHIAQQGLADARMAAAAFAIVGAMFGAIIYAAATRRDRGLAGMNATLWILALGAVAAFVSAIGLALPTPLAAPAAALLALAAIGLDHRFPAAVWRACASIAVAAAAYHALTSADMVLHETPGWNVWLLIGLGVAAPVPIAAAAAHFAERNRRLFAAGALETFAIAAIVIAASLALRIICSHGVVMLTPIGFVELSGHIAIWLSVALGLGARQQHGAKHVRAAASIALGIWGAFVSVLAAGMWLSTYWIGRGDGAYPLLSMHAVGFVAPAVLLLAHWYFWRGHNAPLRARGALAVGALMLAGFIALGLSRLEEAPDWAAVLGGGAAFAAAVGVNFAPRVARA
jgi:hypothetical protein